MATRVAADMVDLMFVALLQEDRKTGLADTSMIANHMVPVAVCSVVHLMVVACIPLPTTYRIFELQYIN